MIDFFSKNDNNQTKTGGKFKPTDYLTDDEQEMFEFISTVADKAKTKEKLAIIKPILAKYLEISFKRYKTAASNNKIITDVIPLANLRLLLIFNHKECRILDLKAFLNGSAGIVGDILQSTDLFQSVKVDNKAHTICFSNEVDFDPEILYRESKKIDDLML